MKTDSEFKILFKKHAAEFLALTESRSDPAALKRWALLAAKGTDADLLKELDLA